jgi:hypothetical protein
VKLRCAFGSGSACSAVCPGGVGHGRVGLGGLFGRGGARLGLAGVIPVGDGPLGVAARPRYYLRRLQATDLPPDPGFSLQTNAEQVDLEHILPKRPDATWDVEDDDVRRLANRLGNQALLRKERNSAVESSSFQNKKQVFATSPYSFTAQISSYDEWDEEAIKKRQGALADIAPRAWPV